MEDSGSVVQIRDPGRRFIAVTAAWQRLILTFSPAVAPPLGIDFLISRITSIEGKPCRAHGFLRVCARKDSLQAGQVQPV